MPFTASARGNYGPQGKGANLPPSWVTASGALSSGTTGTAYSVQLQATDETGLPVTYSLASGSLPNGVSVSSSGLISGTPSAAGSFNFTIRITDIAGAFVDRSFSITTITPFDSGTINYTGGVQSFTITATDTYTLEAWGAQGGNAIGGGNCGGSTGIGGSGGYSKGRITLTAGTVVYVGVGGQGQQHNDESSTSGGWNGGGGSSGTNSQGGGGGGGGATHMSTANGQLRDLSGNTASVLIVAGGGGGAWGTDYTWGDYRGLSDGGKGGGLTGGRGGYGGSLGYTTNCGCNNINNQCDGRGQAYNYAEGGSQSGPGNQANAQGSLSYAAQSAGGFGYGATSNNASSHSGGGGGGGWYGGAGGTSGENANGTGGGGGSSYFKSGMTVVNNDQGQKTGNGQARIRQGSF